MTRGGRAGFALIGALWLVVAIAAAASALARTMESDRLLAQNLAEAIEARLAAEAGIVWVESDAQTALDRAAGLADPASGLDPWARFTERPDSGTVDRARFVTRVRELEALLPINLVEEVDLTEFLEAAGLPTPAALTIAQSLLDWRDLDDLHRGRGAEREWYRERGAAIMPRNGLLGSVEELRYVRGVTPEVFDRIAPMITTLGDGRINANTAPAPVLASLPGLSVVAARRIAAARRGVVRFSSVYDLALRLHGTERDSVEAHLPELVTRMTFETQRLLVEARGRVRAGRIEHRFSALLERQGGTVYRIWIRHGG